MCVVSKDLHRTTEEITRTNTGMGGYLDAGGGFCWMRRTLCVRLTLVEGELEVVVDDAG